MLEDEILRWKELGQVPHLWVRDDDLQKITPAFQRLMLIKVPLMIAAIPEGFDTQCVKLLREGDILVQHGISHQNFGEGKKIEMVDTPFVHEKLMFYFKWLKHASGKFFRPILVPPWNRIEKRLVQRLIEFGYKGLSVDGDQFLDHKELIVINTQLDTTLWKKNKAFKSAFALEEELAAILAWRRQERRMAEPIGILTHHLTMAHQDFETFEAFLEKLKDYGCVFKSFSQLQ